MSLPKRTRLHPHILKYLQAFHIQVNDKTQASAHIFIMVMHGIRLSSVNASSRFGHTYIYGVSNNGMLIVYMKSNFLSVGDFYLSHADIFIYIEKRFGSPLTNELPIKSNEIIL